MKKQADETKTEWHPPVGRWGEQAGAAIEVAARVLVDPGAAQAGGGGARAQVWADLAVRSAVVQAVMALDESARVAVVMRFWEDLPPREIAQRRKLH